MKDVAIIGAGPAGLSAGIYAARAKLSTVIVEKMYPGGQAAITDRIENYPGFNEGIGGSELTDNMKAQAEKFGAELLNGDVIGIKKENEKFIIQLTGETLEAKTVILAMGAESRKLGVKGEKEYTGRGVSYCATCDGAFYTDKPIMMVGGGDTAIEEALYLTRFAESVKVVHRRDQLRATKILQERAFKNEKIKFIWNSVVDEIKGQDMVEEVIVKNVKTGEKTSVLVNGVFVAIGLVPNTSFVKDLVKLNEQGYIITDENMGTGVPGLYAAGDVRQKSLRQVVTAVADGAIAAVEAGKYLESL
ncbi:MAG: thioredoxin reductase [Thermoanaerobacteraceae bacterium]|nr:thioredoxin reductase [Thermoanaerobacteraceae bacterium]MDN5302359.1 thioredoxin reductase [Thermoanaerobacteraceae bacterium]MDN5311869.1 thioredoxin reductase [Thermoanaerobacteraceae bacterium]RKL61720.1 thioredoxin-disulfide reductase [Thermoanaerobacteraceae bacterium SP2]